MDTEEKISSFVWIQVAIIGLSQVLLIAFVAGFIIGHFLTGSDKTVEVAPNGEEISFGTPPPMQSWSLPNGDQYNHRVANSEIDSGNVDELSEAWRLPITAKLEDSYIPAAKYGYFASTPVIDENGIAYFQDADNNVFAVNVKTGQEVWKKEYSLPNEGPNGVTYMNGVVYGCTSMFCFALDSQTGEEIWKTERLTITESEAREQFPAAAAAGATIDTDKGITAKGQGINFAPQVHNGTVFVSTSGQITGGEAIGLDAADGKVLWRTNETKNPEDRPVGGVAGTGGSWNAPAIGPEGTVFYGIGNPYRSDNQAIDSPTELLYNDSTIAVNPDSGKVQWYMQGVPNDFYDWDMQISPVYSEETGRHIVLDAGKMGYVYAMDPKSGELLWKTEVGKHNGHDEDGKLAMEGKYQPPEYPYNVYPGIFGGVETNMAVDEGVAYVVTVNSYQVREGPELVHRRHPGIRRKRRRDGGDRRRDRRKALGRGTARRPLRRRDRLQRHGLHDALRRHHRRRQPQERPDPLGRKTARRQQLAAGDRRRHADRDQQRPGRHRKTADRRLPPRRRRRTEGKRSRGSRRRGRGTEAGHHRRRQRRRSRRNRSRRIRRRQGSRSR